MKAIEFLKANREQVIAKYNELADERFFDGVTLAQFMSEIFARYRSSFYTTKSGDVNKTGVARLPYIVGEIYCSHVKIGVSGYDRDAALAKKYAGTAYMAMV